MLAAGKTSIFSIAVKNTLQDIVFSFARARTAQQRTTALYLARNSTRFDEDQKNELNRLLTLYSKVTHKTLRISKTFGIEGKKLLTPDDDYDALKDFNEQYEGHETPLESLHLEYQKMLTADPALAARLDTFPQRVFSGRKHINTGTKAVFFCYARPGPDDKGEWTESAGDVVWYLYTLAHNSTDEKVIEAPIDLTIDALANLIRSTPDTPRVTEIEQPTLATARKAVEKHIKNTYLKSAQAPLGVKPVLKAWMELN